MDAVVQIGSTESLGNIWHIGTTSCAGIAATELIGLGIAGLGLFALFPMLLMALSMAWYRITGKDGWPIMMGAGLAWLGLAVYGFAQSTSSWDIYQIVGAVSIAMLVLCMLLSYEGSRARKDTIKASIKIQEPPARKSYSERYKEWEKGSGFEEDEDKNSRRRPPWAK